LDTDINHSRGKKTGQDWEQQSDDIFKERLSFLLSRETGSRRTGAKKNMLKLSWKHFSSRLQGQWNFYQQKGGGADEN